MPPDLRHGWGRLTAAKSAADGPWKAAQDVLRCLIGVLSAQVVEFAEYRGFCGILALFLIFFRVFTKLLQGPGTPFLPP